MHKFTSFERIFPRILCVGHERKDVKCRGSLCKIYVKFCFPVSGGVAGVSPAEGVAEDSLLAEARGRLSPSTLLINFQLTHPKVSHHVIKSQSIPHDKFRFRHTKALIHSL